ncbi:MAG TPA: protein translocase subunit SecD [Kineosporiaceae bacterium]|nr:protein translocase subunit SecD [Kineosporiaceae bacterium]
MLGLLLLLYGVVAAGVVWSNAQWKPKLALDLEGGTEIVLAPVPVAGSSGSIDQNTIDRSIEIIRQRVNGSGVSEAEVTSQGQNIVVSLPGKVDAQTKKLVESAAQLRFRAVLAESGTQPAPTGTATMTPAATTTATPGATSTATATPPSASGGPAATLKSSPSPSSNGMVLPNGLLQATPTPTVNATGSPASAPTGSPAAAPTGNPAVTATGGAVAATPGAKPTDASDPNWAGESVPGVAGATYEQLFATLDCAKYSAVGGDDAAKPLVACSVDKSAKYLLGPAEVIGLDIKAAAAGPETNSQGQVTGTGWQVNLSFNSDGAKKFGDVTTRLAALTGARNQFAIVLDGKVISAPTTREAITGGSAQITGSFTEADATMLANQLKFGALPISFKPLTDQEISATLGSEQLTRGLLAGVIGLALVVVYSLLQYRALGFLTVASLGIAGALTFGLVDLLGWRANYRLSLAGVAGLIVSIGITADSFIVYFERVRDEVRDGRNLIPAVESAWIRARRTILASDAVSFLAAVVLFVLALGGVKGFAFTLGLTTLIDVLVVFLFTKPMVTVLARTKFFGGGHKLSGFDPEHLGRSITYAGRGRVRGPGEERSGGTIAERRAAAARATEGPDQPGAEDPGETDVDLAVSKAGAGKSADARPGASSGKES